MKKLICLCTIVLIFTGCAQRFALKGHYRESPYAIPVKQPADTAWLRILDFIAEQNIKPRFLKKKKYLVLTEVLSFKDTYTMEDPDGKPLDLGGYVVLPKLKDNTSLMTATAYWTIKIHTKHEKSTVLIELSKVTATYDSKKEVIKLVGNHVSTGQFEKKLEAYLQK